MIPFPEISPEIFSVSIGGLDFALRWYALAYIIGLLGGWRISVMTARRSHLFPKDQSPITALQLDDLLTWIIGGVILGGRLGYVLFYRPDYYLQNPLDILQVWNGGMSFHGGFLGVVVATYIFCRKHKLPLWSVADLMALSVPLGLLLGRIANFINAELWGRPTDAAWGVIFPGEAAQDCGQAIGQLCARHPSQLYEAAMEGLLLGIVLVWLAYRRGALKAPGTIMGVFLIGYGMARFIVEFVRQPDEQFTSATNLVGYALQFGDYGLTMGQILSLPMIAVGLFFVLRKPANG